MAKAYEGDYEFGMADHFGDDYHRLPSQTPEYVEIGRTFAASLDRVRHLCWLPVELCFWAGLLEYSHCSARHRLGLDPTDHSRDGSPEFLAIAAQVFSEHAPGAQKVDPFKYVWTIGEAQLKVVLRDEAEKKQPKYRTSGIEAVLAAMITAAYAAFETIAGDLWVASVNRHPELAKRYSAKNSDKQLGIATLASYGFDLSGAMGRVWLKIGECRSTPSTTFGMPTKVLFVGIWMLSSRM